MLARSRLVLEIFRSQENLSNGLSFSSHFKQKLFLKLNKNSNYSNNSSKSKSKSKNSKIPISYSLFLNETSIYSNLHTKKKWLLRGLIGASFLYLLNNGENRVAFAEGKDEKNEIENILKKADKLYDEEKKLELLEFLLEANKKHSKLYSQDNAQILWRLARACHDVALIKGSDKNKLNEKKQLFYEGQKYAKLALDLDPNHFACQKWCGITLNDIGEFEGTKVLISNSYKIRDHFLKAIQLNPNDGTSHYLMGVWCYNVASLPWYSRTIASTIFATPPTSSIEEALTFFLNAEEVEPGFYKRNCTMIGQCFLKLGEKEESKRWLERALKMKIKNDDDKEAHDLAEKLLKQM